MLGDDVIDSASLSIEEKTKPSRRAKHMTTVSENCDLCMAGASDPKPIVEGFFDKRTFSVHMSYRILHRRNVRSSTQSSISTRNPGQRRRVRQTRFWLIWMTKA